MNVLTSFSVTTVYPVVELGMNPLEGVAVSEVDATQEPAADNAATQSFLPTVAVFENSLEASTTKPETQTSVPLIPNVIPESTPAITDETPSTSSVEEESTEDAPEESGDIIKPDTQLETVTEPEVEDIPPTEHDDGGEAEPEGPATDSKATSG